MIEMKREREGVGVGERGRQGGLTKFLSKT
jgi:hypothetical protein